MAAFQFLQFGMERSSLRVADSADPSLLVFELPGSLAGSSGLFCAGFDDEARWLISGTPYRCNSA